MSLASDLRWLLSEGHVIEFNDGSLDLPRSKAKSSTASAGAPATEPGEVQTENVVAAVVSTAEPEKQAIAAVSASATDEVEIGGS